VFCEVNEQFAPTGFYFYIQGDIDYIDNSDYHEHDFTSGAQMMLFNNVNNRLNMYFVDDPAGNCGYFSPFSDAVVIAKSCAGLGSTTVAHELGHFFSLPHTFFGWESGTPPSAQQERVNGSNCNTAADRFCDTPPDYTADRWNCPGSSFTDLNGESFSPDGTLYMSYSNDACTSRFSNEQQAAMRANLVGLRSDLQTSTDPSIVELDSVSLTEPLDGTVNTPFNYTVLKWTKSLGASSYVVTIGLNPPMTAIVLDAIVSDTFFILTDLDLTRRYYWKVAPVAEGSTCASYSQTWDFITGEVASGIFDAASIESNLVIFPNPVSGSMAIMQVKLDQGTQAFVKLYDALGHLVYSEPHNLIAGVNRVEIMLEDLVSGMYLVELDSDVIRHTDRIVISK
ncbi:MAG: hypothetical protein ACI959_001399, partial [Limisphaerales bacterium]